MNNIEIISDLRVEEIFVNYPDFVRSKMQKLRELIFETADEIEGLPQIEETFKWGEPAYLTRFGSTIRIDWKQKNPDIYAVYFQCTSRLVPTFKIMFKDVFKFEGKRAITLFLNEELPVTELKMCFKAALMYHKVKHLPALGI